jgi:hypothetical protein
MVKIRTEIDGDKTKKAKTDNLGSIRQYKFGNMIASKNARLDVITLSNQ